RGIAHVLTRFLKRIAPTGGLRRSTSFPTPSAYPPTGGPADSFLAYESFFYAENEPANGWQIVLADGQKRLFQFDVDDQGYLYLAYSLFGWGIVKDDFGSSGALMQSMHQHYFSNPDDVLPHEIAVVKTCDG